MGTPSLQHFSVAISYDNLGEPKLPLGVVPLPEYLSGPHDLLVAICDANPTCVLTEIVIILSREKAQGSTAELCTHYVFPKVPVLQRATMYLCRKMYLEWIENFGACCSKMQTLCLIEPEWAGTKVNPPYCLRLKSSHSKNRGILGANSRQCLLCSGSWNISSLDTSLVSTNRKVSHYQTQNKAQYF